MAFPETPLDVFVDIWVDDAWVTIPGGDVRQSDGIKIRRGRSSEASHAAPSTCNLKLNNRHGNYSPRNPTSPYYRKIGRNTPLRVRRGSTFTSQLHLQGSQFGGYASTPDASALDITGDLDVRVDVTGQDWRPAAILALASKFDEHNQQRSWALWILTSGKVELTWSINGLDGVGNRLVAASTVALPADTTRIAIRATLDVNNGSGGNTVTFYTAPTIGGSWTQLGAPVVTSGTTSIYSSTADVVVGALHGGAAFSIGRTFSGLVHAFELRSGINGTLVADPDFTTHDTGVASFTDAAGRAWSTSNLAAFTNSSTRFIGEVVSWPSRWERSGADVWVPVEANGIGRRLGQGDSPLKSPMYRTMTDATAESLVGYWPAEDASGATQLASGIGGPPLGLFTNVDNGQSVLASYDDSPASDPIPVMKNGWFEGLVPPDVDTGELRVWALIAVPTGGVPQTVQVLNVRTSGSAGEFMLVLNPDGSIFVNIRNAAGTDVFTSGPAFPSLNGGVWLLGMWLRQVGGDVVWQRFRFEAGGLAGVASGTLVGYTFGHATSVAVGIGGDLGDTAMGHIAVKNRGTSELDAIAGGVLAGFANERATYRMERLASEADFLIVVDGDHTRTELLGTQGRASLQALIREAADADLGLLFDSRDIPALRYRTRDTLYNQVPIELQYGDLSDPPDPTDDDQATRNDIEVKRTNGSSVRVVDTTSPLSVLPPPDGAGPYDTSVTINIAKDFQLPDQAGWRLHLGTIDESRWPKVPVNLARNTELIDVLSAVDVGDRITVADPPAWLPQKIIDLIVQGYEEVLNAQEWMLTFNCSPGSAYRVFELDSLELGRLASTDSTLAAGITSSATTMLVATESETGWTENPAHMPVPLDIGGEEIDATAIAPARSDTFTRSVASGWGTATSGQVWTTSGGSAADFSVSGTQGLVSQGTEDVVRLTVLPLGSATVDVSATVATNKIAAGAGQLVGIFGRYTSSSNFYFLRPVFETNQSITLYMLKKVAGVETVLAAVALVGLTHGAATRFALRLKIVGDQVRGKIWLASAAEPGGWDLKATDSALTAAGDVGFYQLVPGANSAALPIITSWDDLVVRNPQVMTVTRSTNGVVKAHSVNDQVALVERATIAL